MHNVAWEILGFTVRTLNLQHTERASITLTPQSPQTTLWIIYWKFPLKIQAETSFSLSLPSIWCAALNHWWDIHNKSAPPYKIPVTLNLKGIQPRREVKAVLIFWIASMRQNAAYWTLCNGKGMLFTAVPDPTLQKLYFQQLFADRRWVFAQWPTKVGNVNSH